jgi:hypothetical protein
MGKTWSVDRNTLHQRQGLAPVKLPARRCSSCSHYAAQINWCRLLQKKNPGGCPEQVVQVSFEGQSPDPCNNGRSSRRPSGD